jgi:MFS family permease
MVILAMKVIPSKQELSKDAHIDFLGAVLAFISLSSLIYAINSISGLGLRNPSVISCFAISIVALILFIIQEMRTRNPILHIPLFFNRDFVFATASAFCVVFVYIGLVFLLPFYLNMVQGHDMMSAGLMLMVPSLMLMIFAPVAGIASDRFGSRVICTIGIAMTTSAFFLFSSLQPKASIHSIMPSLILAGIAIGCFLPANNKLVMMHAPSDRQGMASAVYKILNSTGGVFGIAILPLVLMKKIYALAGSLHMDIAAIKSHPEILSAGFGAAFKFGMLVCIVGLIFTILARDKKIKV